MSITTLLILILACWRISSLLVNEDGPFDMFVRLRLLAGVRYDEWSRPFGENVVAGVLSCLWCCSVWIGVGLAIAWWLWPGYTFWICLPLALSAGAVVVDEMTKNA